MRVSILIPLYQSARFHQILAANIAAHLGHDCEILISDQHRLDDAIERLQRDFQDQSQLRFFSSSNSLNWVENINLLLNEAQGDYLRILPHDDSSDWDSTDALCRALDENPQAVNAYGRVRAYDLHGNRLLHKEANALGARVHRAPGHPEIEGVRLYWRGYHPGSFKGVIRRETVERYGLEILATPSLADSERLWLAALRMCGDFVFVDRDVLNKRYHAESAHAQWRVDAQHLVDAGITLDAYIRQLLPAPAREVARKTNWFYCHNRFLTQSGGFAALQPPWEA